MPIRIDNLQICINAFPADAPEVESLLKPHIIRHSGLKSDEIASYQVISKSIDARRKPPSLIYSLQVNLPGDAVPKNEPFVIPENHNQLLHPVIVGTGPAGLLAAWVLAAAGCKPLILDRGFDVETRAADIARFRATRDFNPESNYLFGEGGAGTFSDGKLYTRTKDPLIQHILELFVKAGAPPEILYLKRPHIGSDLLPGMIGNIRRQIIAMGGTFRFGCGVKSIILEDGKCRGVITADGEKISAPAVLLACGLGGRELTQELLRLGAPFQQKGFQIGCRIEHRQEMMDRNQYGLKKRPAFLGASEYNFVSRPPESKHLKNISTFCMCPGGEIVPSGAFAGQLSTNGMSPYHRDGQYANSCLIATCDPEEFATVEAAFKFLTALESKTFAMGGGDYTAPAQSAAAFARRETFLKSNEGSYCFGLKPAPLHELLPRREADSIAEAIVHFEKLCPGFMRYGTLTGVETFVSSPVRFQRESLFPGLYMAGEGAGFAGGIISAAVDGLRTALQIISTCS